MKLMVNVCGHPMCDSCVRMYFLKESAPCPECEIVLKRSKFRVQIYEDPLVEKELAIRRKVMKVYNMAEDDFPTLEEWNSYLEEIEEIVYNITNDINKPEMEKKMENYEKLNKNEIRKNYARKTRAEEELERQLDSEMVKGLERQRALKEEQEKSKLTRQRNKTSLIQDLMAASEGAATLVLKSHTERLKEEQKRENQKKKEQELAMQGSSKTEFSSGVKMGFAAGMSSAPVHQMKEELYRYEPPVLSSTLPAPTWEELEDGGYLNHVRRASPQAMAGGYTEHYACLRALQDFMSSHFLS